MGEERLRRSDYRLQQSGWQWVDTGTSMSRILTVAPGHARGRAQWLRDDRDPRDCAGEIKTCGQPAGGGHFGFEEEGVGQPFGQLDFHLDRVAGADHVLELD